MEQRALGKTGMTVSAIGFGCGNVGGLMIRGTPAEQREGVAVALDAGIRYFDTAPSYGDGASEAALGRTLRELRADVLVGTKFNVEPEEADVGGAMRRSLEASLARLGRDHVDLLQLHSRIAGSRSGKKPALSVELVTGPIAEILSELKRSGTIRAAGFTGLDEPDSLLRVVESGHFDTVQAYLNIFNLSAAYAGAAPGGQPDFAGLIGRAATDGLGVIAIRVLAAGAVSGADRAANASPGGGSLMPGLSFDDDVRRSGRPEAIIAALGLENAAELAIRCAITVPGVSTALVGFSGVAQVEDAARYAARGPLRPDAMERIRATS